MKLFRFFIGWSFERYFRLGLAILAGIYALSTKEYSILIVTAWLGILALLNISCCGVGACNSSQKKQQKETTVNNISVKYEEIKNGN